MRNNAILQTLVGPGEEHTTLAGLPTEAISGMPSRPPFRLLQSSYAPRVAVSSSGSWVKKRQPADEGRQGQAALLALATYSELKILFWLMKMSTSLTATISCGR
nr:UbiD family decarboxylase [Klebsiella pneumoniae subsp. pneumoniae]